MRTALFPNAEPAAVSRRFAQLLPVALGVGLLVIGLVIMTGWVLQEPRLLLLIPGYRIVFNTALCFALAASALICNVLGARPRMLVQTTIGAVLVLFAGAVLSQHFTGVGLGLDWSGMHAWLRDTSAYPGRMGPATCVAFLLSGACLIAMHQATGKSAPYLIRGLQITVIGIGLFAAIGQILGLASMFEVYLFRQVSLPIASGFVVLGTALWLSTERLVFDTISDEERILYTGTTVLVVFGFVVGLAGLGTLKINAEAALGEGLELTASSRASLPHHPDRQSYRVCRVHCHPAQHPPAVSGACAAAGRSGKPGISGQGGGQRTEEGIFLPGVSQQSRRDDRCCRKRLAGYCQAV